MLRIAPYKPRCLLAVVVGRNFGADTVGGLLGVPPHIEEITVGRTEIDAGELGIDTELIMEINVI